jgi:hypothetical protein
MSGRQVQFIYPFTQAHPPVYLCGTFTYPAWTPIEMHAVPLDPATGSSDNTPRLHRFERVLNLNEGVWEYKFRVGESHWVCDDKEPTSMSKLNVSRHY